MVKRINLTIILILILSLFSVASVDFVEDSSETLSEKVLEEHIPEIDNDDKVLKENIVCFTTSLENLKVFVSFKDTNTYIYTNSILRPPIFS